MIRPIELSDIDSLFEVRGLTRENQFSVEDLQALDITPETIKSGLCSTLFGNLYEANNKVVGFAMGDKSNGEITVIALLPEYENKGIGKLLLTEVENILFEAGWKEIWLTTDINKNLRAYGFYIKQGWEDNKIEHGDRYMVKRLNSLTPHRKP